MNGSSKPSVLVVGSVAYDNIISPHGRGDWLLGGSASYGSIAASYFAPTRLVGVVGGDFRDEDRQRLSRHNIDLAGLQTNPQGKTFFWEGEYASDFSSRTTRDLQLNVFETFEPQLPEPYSHSDFVLVGNIQPSLQARVMDMVSNPTAFHLIDTIDFWIGQDREAVATNFRRASAVVINDSEVALFTGESNPILGARKMLADGTRTLILKKGEHGVLLFTGDTIFALPAYPVTDLRDPTGAGDSFAGALLGRLAELQDSSLPALKQALLYATATASLTVEAFSTNRLESAGRPEIEARVAELRRMVSL
ncbi:MAG: PfkB family carbohydrate kinase [Puniceicoccaceae bacterium]